MKKVNLNKLSKEEAIKKGAHYDIFVEAPYTQEFNNENKLIKTTMKKEMKCKIIYLTPTVAQDLLSRNDSNRILDKNKITDYARLMRLGLWKENGEPLIVDWNSQVKNGQHRLHACIKTGFCFNIPFVYDVSPDVMDTIDTGKNRTMGDIFSLNHINNANASASVVKIILAQINGQQTMASDVNGVRSVSKRVSNTEGLNYALENKAYLSTLVSRSLKISHKSINKPFSGSLIGGFYNMLCKGDLDRPFVNDFLREISGLNVQESTGAAYVNRLVTKSKIDKTPLNGKYVNGLIIKAWNLYINGNPEITYIKFDSKKELPAIN